MTDVIDDMDNIDGMGSHRRCADDRNDVDATWTTLTKPPGDVDDINSIRFKRHRQHRRFGVTQTLYRRHSCYGRYIDDRFKTA